MKNLFFFLSVLAIPCVAQPKPSSPQVVVDPAAKVLLDGATATYHAAKGIRFKVAVKEKNTSSNYSVSFQRPNLFLVETLKEGETSKIIVDGKAIYSVDGTTYKRGDAPDSIKTLWQPLQNSGTGVLTSAMLDGRSPIAVLQDFLKESPYSNPRMIVSVPPPAVVDGVALNGTKISFQGSETPKAAPKTMTVIYLWFGGDGLLRRVSTNSLSSGDNFQSTEQISDAQLNPTFEPDTFKFNATGLTMSAEAAAGEEPPMFDPRLKVGATPFAFSAKTLTGQTISPATYKGKVLILDFWATWCGPCVGALPELKGVYDKYHAKGVDVLGISLDEDKSALTSFIKAHKMPWQQIYDGKGWGSRVPGMYGVQAIPFMLIIGKNGKIAAVNPRDDLEGAVKKALAAS